MSERKFWNPERQTMSTGALRELQNERVSYQARLAYENAPVIRELWDEHDVSPSDINTVEDLAAVPTFRKDSTRNRQIERGEMFGGRRIKPMSVLAEDGARIYSSSGTTGVSTNVAFTRRDIDVLAETVARDLWEMGLRPGDVLINWQPGFHVAADAFTRAAEKIGAHSVPVPHTSHDVSRIAHSLEYMEPKVLTPLTPPMLDPLEKYYEERGIDPIELWEPVESVLFGGEPLTPATRARIGDWGVDVYEFSGGLEPGWWPTERASKGRWLHVASDHFYVEARDPETGERVPEGERGELVVTPLSQEGLSHFCWAHDDIVKIKRGPFDNGEVGARVKFLGRVDDLIEVAGKRVLPLDVMLITSGVDEMPNDLFQFYEGATEVLRMRIACDPDTTDDPDSLASDVQHRIEDELGIPVEITEVMTEAEMQETGPVHKIPRIISE